ncbi:hypothetical protein VPH35_041227 [Triticum aestivum]
MTGSAPYVPDDMLIMILDKLDARTTIITTILSKRWLHLPRGSHTSYFLSVHQLLPPRYYRLKQILMDVKAGYQADKKNTQNLTDFVAVRGRYEQWMGRIRRLSSVLQRYERRAMRCYIKRVNAFLLAPRNVLRRRSVKKLRIESFRTSSGCIDQWITAAIAGCGVEDLELAFEGFGCHLYDFRLLDGLLQNVRLKRLVLSRCFHHFAFNSLLFHSLTELTLCKILDLGSVGDVLTNCVKLVDFRLKYSCVYYPVLRICAPASKLKRLQMWIEPTAIPSAFSHLRKLFIANVPIYWDILWIFILLDAAPCLESLHVHIDKSSENMGAGLDVQGEEYHLLKELVVIGFNGVSWQTCFVKRMMRALPRLMRIHLLDGHVVEDDDQELGSLEIVPHRREWEECEKLEVIDDLVDGFSLHYWEIILE